MDIPVESWYNAIFLRHSQRKYSGNIPNEKVISEIEGVCVDFIPFPGVRSVLVREPVNDVFKGAVGEYFLKVTEAPYYIAFIADTSAPNAQAITGYIGEGIILEATSLGLNTCWVGGFFRREAVMKQIDLRDDERVLAITPVGYAESDSDSVGKSSIQHRRKDLKKLITNKDSVEDSWIQTALEAARLAPSAANRQPWRFTIGADSICISADSKREGLVVSRKLDCGIAMLHIELGVRISGITGSWEFLKYPNIAEFKIG